MNLELLKKYFNNNCTSEEVDVIIEWFKINANGLEGRSIFKQLWNDVKKQEVHSVDFNQMLDKIHHRINLESSKKVDHPAISKKNRIKPFMSYMVKIAATLFLPLLAISFYYYNKEVSKLDEQVYSEIISPNGSRTFFELPDGSKVWLNNGSSLRFPIRFTGDYRVLELKGEAYFDIAHNDDMPLIVKSNQLQVFVHGTKFNVNAYSDNDNISVTLESGSISLQKVNRNNEAKNILKLKPNQQAVYNKVTNEIEYGKININKYTSWRYGKLVFIDDPIDVIIEKLERWYNVDIKLMDKELSKITYTATFTDETLQQVLYLLKVATPIEYKIYQSNKLNDGSFSKRIVEISNEK